MRTLTLSTIVAAMLFPAATAQIPNHGFENWSSVHQVIEPTSPGWGFLTSAQANDRPLFAVQGHPSSLRGYCKFIPENSDTMNITLFLYKDGNEIAFGQFQSTVAQTRWTPFTVAIGTCTAADSARISLSAANEPKNGKTGPRGNSVLYVDNYKLELRNTKSEIWRQTRKMVLIR